MGLKKGWHNMKNLLGAMWFAWLFLQAGCVTPQQHTGLIVSVADTIDGQENVVSARVGEDGRFNNSIVIGDRTRTISGKVTKTGDSYFVAIDYNSTRLNAPGLTQIRSNLTLQEGDSQDIGGGGNVAVYISISSD